jgi:hypothetical protein
MDLSLIKGIVDRAIVGIKQEFASVERLRDICKLHEAMPADGVVTTALCRVVLLNAAADALGLDATHPDFIEHVRNIKASAKMATDSMARDAAKDVYAKA